MTSRNDVSIPNWLRASSLASTANLANPGDPTGTFAHQPLLGYNGFSITVSTLAGSTATGTINVQCTDCLEHSLYDPNAPWVNMNYPGTSTPVAFTISSGANSYNLQVFGAMCKYIRLRFTNTAGTGTLNAGITCRANSR